MQAFLLVIWLIFTNSVFIFRLIKKQLAFDFDFIVSFIASNALAVFIANGVSRKIQIAQLYPDHLTFWSWLNWGLVQVLFFFFLWSYLFRTKPIVKANKASEILLPIFCSFIPFLINESTSWQRFDFVREQSFLLSTIKPYYVQTPNQWNVFSLAAIISGDVLTIAAMISLKKSFSIFSEVRIIVTSGVYRYFRHPMYVGESLATIGILLLSPSHFNILLTLLFITGLFFRAQVEERKLEKNSPDYVKYKNPLQTQ